jgi:hypothetical protein
MHTADESSSEPASPPPTDLPPADAAAGQGLARVETVDPQRLLRIAGVTREVLEEARRIRPEPGAVDHLRRVHGRITSELREALPHELFEELADLTPGIKDGSLEELALAHAEILGWLEGLFQGTQLALQLQAARTFGDSAQRRRLPAREGEEETPDSRYL